MRRLPAAAARCGRLRTPGAARLDAAGAQPRGRTSDWTSGRPFQSLDATVACALASRATLACASAGAGFTSSRAGATFCASVMKSR